VKLPAFLQAFGRVRRYAARVDAPVKRLAGLRAGDAFTIAVGTVLSARTRDDRLYGVLGKLFGLARTPQAILRLSDARLRRLLRPLGFYRMKTRILKAFCRTLLRDFRGRVPRSRDELLTLPGVGIKVAAIIQIEAFGQNEISVDTHVHRIMNRLGFVRTRTPEQTCRLLYEILPRRLWRHVNGNLVALGQTLCRPVSPLCPRCPARPWCARRGVNA
jgi:endonuclease III